VKDPLAMPAVRLELTLEDGTVLVGEWTVTNPALGVLRATLKDPPPWLVPTGKKWDHPQDPVTMMASVRGGHERDARTMLEAFA
jgi:hypothetical protein